MHQVAKNGIKEVLRMPLRMAGVLGQLQECGT